MSNQTILITGASSGIGKATAKFFHEKGWNVIATMRSPEKEKELTQLENVHVTGLDVQEPTSIEAAIAEGIDRFGAIDAVLNNAGYAVMGPFEAVSEADTERQFDVNVLGVLRVTRAVLPHFRERGRGLFLNVSSMGGRTTFPLISLYHSTKWAVEGFSESLHYELLPLGIGVKLIQPGAIATDFGSRSMTIAQAQTKDYDEVSAAIQALFSDIEYGSSDMVAEVIFKAATDGTSTLRYAAGQDAEQALAARVPNNEEDLLEEMRKRFGLA